MTKSDEVLVSKWDSLEACKGFACRLAGLLVPPLTIRLDGTLGAGKTQFTKFLAQALGANCDEVTSPTFVLIHRYESRPVIYHVDAYRVGDEDEFLELGIEELFDEKAITIIEWGSKFLNVLPQDHLALEIDIVSDRVRMVRASGTGQRSRELVSQLQSGLS